MCQSGKSVKSTKDLSNLIETIHNIKPNPFVVLFFSFDKSGHSDLNTRVIIKHNTPWPFLIKYYIF